MREYLDIADGSEKYHKADWKRRIDCIEAFPDYITPVHRFVYDNIYEGDASEIVPKMAQKYDVALFIDVLEHFTYEEGAKLLRSLRGRGTRLLISVPKDNGEQTDAFGNVWETHRHEWSRPELQAFGPSFSIRNDRSTIVYIGEDARRIQARYLLGRISPSLEWWLLRQIANRRGA
jgi:hypothetical protein